MEGGGWRRRVGSEEVGEGKEGVWREGGGWERVMECGGRGRSVEGGGGGGSVEGGGGGGSAEGGGWRRVGSEEVEEGSVEGVWRMGG